MSDNRVNGLTTAATIWATAALGMGIGGGYYAEVLIATLFVFISLFMLTKLEDVIDKINQTRIYKILVPYKDNLLDDYEKQFRKNRLRFKRLKQTKTGADLQGQWLVHGSDKSHKKFVETILHDASVKEFEF